MSELTVRPLAARDAMDVWRLYRDQVATLSPFFFVVVTRHCADVGVVAVRDDDVVGFALANPKASDGKARLLALCIAADEADATAAVLISQLLTRPAFRDVCSLETPAPASLPGFPAPAALAKGNPFEATGCGAAAYGLPRHGA